MKPLYLVGTQRDVGKTTMSLGLLKAFSDRGIRVAYAKPLDQRIKGSKGHIIHDDARVVANFLGLADTEAAGMAIPLPSGRVEKEVLNLHTDKLAAKVMEQYSALEKGHDVVIIEAMGHVAMGSCLGLSAAHVAHHLGAKTLLVSGGGIGKALDEISLCATFIDANDADLIGVVVNKVWPAKYDRVKLAVTQGLSNMNIRTFGIMPYEPYLSAPTVEQVYHLVGGEIIAGQDKLSGRVMNTIVAAMEAGNMVPYLEDDSLVIMPGDRSDNILATLSSHLLADHDGARISGIILTGGLNPSDTVMKMLRSANIPVILIEGDTYFAANKLKQAVFKITPEDHERAQWAVNLVAKHVDIDAILDQLKS